MVTDRCWKLFAVWLLLLQSGMGDPSRTQTYLTLPPDVHHDPPPSPRGFKPGHTSQPSRGRHNHLSTTVPTVLRNDAVNFPPPTIPLPVWNGGPPEPIREPPRERCLDSSEVVLRLSRIGIRIVGDGVVVSSRVTELHLDENGITEVSTNAFDKLPNLQTLNVSMNNISTDRLLWFGEHKSLRRLIVDDNKRCDPKLSELKLIYKPLPNLWELSLRRSHITVFAVSLNDFVPHLGRFSLSGNEIESSEFLKDAPKTLKHLDLSENRIQEIQCGWLPNSLMDLMVAGNKIKELCVDSCEESSLCLRGLTHLKTLNASSNQISVVREDAFQDLRDLISLDLSGNKIKRLSENLWDSTRYIEMLNLAKNQLATVPKLCKLHELLRLDLSNNHIGAVTHDSFCLQELNKLESLFLNDNYILEVDGVDFKQLTGLRRLDLSDNAFTVVPRSLISSTFLNQLFMRNNSIASLENLDKEHGALRELHLQDNPLLFIRTTWINANNLPHLQIMLKDHPNDTPADGKTDKNCQKENEQGADNSDEDW